jgi:hypothetical protein
MQMLPKRHQAGLVSKSYNAVVQSPNVSWKGILKKGGVDDFIGSQWKKI